jgi:phosphate transport system substrate-binding protein
MTGTRMGPRAGGAREEGPPRILSPNLAQFSWDANNRLTNVPYKLIIKGRVVMKKVVRLAVALMGLMAAVGLAQAEDMTINAAGATFPYPIYSQWAHKYNSMTGVKLNYQSIGSGGGIAQIKAKTVDYGASDAPLKAEDLQKNGLVQFPMVMGGEALVVNLPGIGPGQLKLTSATVADIYLGKIKKWDDPAITKLNSGLKLPSQEITVVHRSDGSGTTFIFASYLSAVSPEWKQKVGANTSVQWPVGIGGKGNEGVAGQVKNVSGSIGYVEYAYAIQNKMTHTQLQNKAGKFLNPSIEVFEAAAANADWKNAPYGFYLMIVDQPGEASWPIAGATFILLHKDQTDPAKVTAMLKWFDWCFKHGSDMAKKLDYVPMPEAVVKLVEESWAKDIKVNGQPVKY